MESQHASKYIQRLLLPKVGSLFHRVRFFHTFENATKELENNAKVQDGTFYGSQEASQIFLKIIKLSNYDILNDIVPDSFECVRFLRR